MDNSEALILLEKLKTLKKVIGESSGVELIEIIERLIKNLVKKEEIGFHANSRKSK